MSDLIDKKSKSYRWGYLVGHNVARTEYRGGISFINQEDPEMMSGYNEGFSKVCGELGKDPRVVVARLDADKEPDHLITQDVVVYDQTEEFYGFMRMQIKSTLWEPVQFVLIKDDDEVAFQVARSEIEVRTLRMVDDVIRAVVTLTRPIEQYAQKSLVQ